MNTLNSKRPLLLFCFALSAEVKEEMLMTAFSTFQPENFHENDPDFFMFCHPL